jgi:hypothetical protein
MAVNTGQLGAVNPQLAAILDAMRRAGQSFGAGQQRLAPGQFQGGQFGQWAAQNLYNPQGYNPADVEAMKAEAAQTLAGSTAAQQNQLKAHAGTSGFGGGVEEGRLSAEIQAGGARDLLSMIRQINMAQEQAKLQQQGMAAGLGGQAMSLEAMMNQLAASGYFGRQFPAVAVGGGGAGGGQYKYLDPQTGRVTYPGPWTAADQAAMQAERMRWEQQNAGG